MNEKDLKETRWQVCHIRFNGGRTVTLEVIPCIPAIYCRCMLSYERCVHTIARSEYTNAINRRHASADRVWNPARKVRRVYPSRMQVHLAVHRRAGCTRILPSLRVLRLRHFFPRTRAPEEWKSSLCGMSFWYGRAIGKFRRSAICRAEGRKGEGETGGDYLLTPTYGVSWHMWSLRV